MATARERRGWFWHQLIPRTRLGWLTVALALGIGLFLAVAYVDGALGLETTDFAPAIVIPGGLSILCGLAAVIVGIASIAGGERSFLVYAAITLGFAYAGAWIFTIVVGLSGTGAHPPGPRPPP